jgi:hypothetical protein
MINFSSFINENEDLAGRTFDEQRYNTGDDQVNSSSLSPDKIIKYSQKRNPT